MSLKARRTQLVFDIVGKDPTNYGYLPMEPFATNISNNYHQFSNDFLEALYKAIVDFDYLHG